MKQKCISCCSVLFFLLFLIAFSSTSARNSLMAAKQLNHQIHQLEVTDSTSDELMGLEICDNGDEKCLKRRLIAEAHLDYIYTQHHRP